ncbi:MAG: CopG family ribbon-helix-helix protein, partial [Candidatus Bathyarchaeia archaeon]
AIHAALRSFIAESEWASKTDESEGAGAVLLVSDHEVTGLEAALTDAQHAYRSIIAASMHLHLDELNCLLVIGVRGLNKKIKALTKDLAACRGVKQLKVSFVKP